MMLVGDRTLIGADATALARFLDEPRLDSGAEVRIGVRDQDGVKQLRQAHVWHCSLSLHPSEPEQTDARWGKICERFIVQMGFDTAPIDDVATERCRWVAIRHGRSVGGSDHTHIVVQLVSESGVAASPLAQLGWQLLTWLLPVARVVVPRSDPSRADR